VKDQIKTRARELGFDDCRITTAQAPESARHFEEWLRRQGHGEMGWLQRNAFKRVDPSQVLNDARSIVTLAVSYHSPLFPPLAPVQSSSSGVIARYARYRDYHDILAEPLRNLTDSINQIAGPNTRSLWYVDTGPFLERDIAQRAGIGFVGKHTNLISKKLGNWFFLAEIITTASIEPDAPERNRCGTCDRCITCCPTDAITAPFQLDARRCISYLTIELKGSIPVDLRPAIGNRIYGCDDCLAACPWNRFASESNLLREHFRADLNQPDLLELLALDDVGFKARFAGTPLIRTKRRGVLRNVCVALGNVGDAKALPALEKAAHDPEPLIAEHARWAIEEINARSHGQIIHSAHAVESGAA
jgi:epoxyqueuosine reductase